MKGIARARARCCSPRISAGRGAEPAAPSTPPPAGTPALGELLRCFDGPAPTRVERVAAARREGGGGLPGGELLLVLNGAVRGALAQAPRRGRAVTEPFLKLEELTHLAQ